LRLGALLLAAMLFAGAGCVERIAESRVRSALVNGGVGERTAGCMAERMVDRLTIAQLRKLEAVRDRPRSLAQYLDAVGRIGDPEVVGVTASSAALCAAGLAS
jgi:hypothetical protein